jgi:hypothetical protein
MNVFFSLNRFSLGREYSLINKAEIRAETMATCRISHLKYNFQEKILVKANLLVLQLHCYANALHASDLK